MTAEEQHARFHEILDRLTREIGGAQRIADLHAGSGIPRNGVYFLFESGEVRSTGSGAPRVVQVGGSVGLRSRLMNVHRGRVDGGGSQRSSQLRRLVGAALIKRERARVPSWLVAQSIPGAAKTLGIEEDEVRRVEDPWEREVTRVVRQMSVVWLDVGDSEAAPRLIESIKKSAIGLLTSEARFPPSPGWLGRNSPNPVVQRYGLWNDQFIGLSWDPAFLDDVARLVG